MLKNKNNKNKVIIGATLVVLTMVASFSFVNSISPTKVSAESSSDLVEIGILYDIEHVSQDTKVYVSGTSKTWAEEAGRTIYEEVTYETLPGPGIGVLSDTASPTSITYPVIAVTKYYYVADDTHGKIVDRHVMYNDYASLVHALEYLEAEANYYSTEDGGAIVNDLEYSNNMVNSILGYVRGINDNYANEWFTIDFDNDDDDDGLGIVNYWNEVAGEINNSFVTAVNSMDNGGMKIKEYFASFVSNSSYNSELHGSIETEYLNNNYRMIHPLTNTATVDIIHMFTTMDGTIQHSRREATNNILDTFLSMNEIRNLSGWAGDLQTAAKNYDYDEGTFSFTTFDIESDVFGNSSSGFGYEDLYADVDAVNIVGLLNSNEISSLAALVLDYYSSVTTATYKSTFVTNVAKINDSDTTDITYSFCDIVYEMLALNFTSLSSTTPNTITGSVTNFSFMIKYKLMGTNPSSLDYTINVETNVRLAMAQSFCLYFINS